MSNPLDRLRGRFQELSDQRQAVRINRRSDGISFVDPTTFYAWATSVQNVLIGAFGEHSPQYQAFKRELETIQGNNIWEDKFLAVSGIFIGAKSDIDGDHFYRMERSILGEVFGDLVVASKAALSEGHHIVAAVLASAALEDALKRFAASEGLDVQGQTMEHVVNALKSKGLVSGAQKSLLGAMPKIRNAAMHADWERLTAQEAGSLVGFVEQFLLSHFG